MNRSDVPGWKRWLAAAGAGRAVYLAWHAPLAWCRRSRREGGPWQQWLDHRGRRAMQAAARRLPVQAPVASGAPEAYFLTGRRFWYQTAFCAASLAGRSGHPWRFTFHDDGTFDDALTREATRLFPGCRVVSRTETETRLERALPAARFPALRSQRLTYLHLRKLTDVHAGLEGWRLVLDSDMLFFRRPDEVLAWSGNPTVALHLTDVSNAYGYPATALTQLAGAPLPERLNVGVCGLRSDTIDWTQLEDWTAALLSRHGTSYYLEQALVALLAARAPACLLPPSRYHVLPTEEECRRPTAVLHHYVDLSKRGYFRHAWKHQTV